MTTIKEGESPLVRYKGRGVIAQFKLIHGKEVIEPWKGKNATVMEWMRNASAMTMVTREEVATFWKIENDYHVFYEDAQQPETMKTAFFSAARDGKSYDVAYRLIPKNLKLGDTVKLTILGCCSIIEVERIAEDETLS